MPTAFDEETTCLAAPPGWTPEQCEPLPICFVPGSGDGGTPHQIVSCWKLTAGELEEIQRTGRVWLIVLGVAHPPVKMTGHYPFVRAEPDTGCEGV